MTDTELPLEMIINGDCIEEMRKLPDNSIDAVVTDPPYGISFMSSRLKKDGHEKWDEFGDDRMADYAPSDFIQPVVMKDGADRLEQPVFADPVNPRCLTCNHYRYSGTPCRCEVPNWDRKPNATGLSYQRWCTVWATECLRVLKPGGWLLSFGGTRTVHRLASAIEDAGFEIRDMLAWVQLQGFPKSLDVAKAIDAHYGEKGELGEPKSEAHAGWIKRGRMRGEEGHEGWQNPWMDDPEAVEANARKYIPATEDGKKWDGYGTALKPAIEPIVMARKPLIGSVARNVLAFGTGVLNIDATRIGTSKDIPASPSGSRHVYGGGWRDQEGDKDVTDTTGWDPNIGRWPPNVILTEPAFDAASPYVIGGGDRDSGMMKEGTMQRAKDDDETRVAYGKFNGGPVLRSTYGDKGGVSRFFQVPEDELEPYPRVLIVPKASKSDREPNVYGRREGGLEEGAAGTRNPSGRHLTRGYDKTIARRLNVHPTAKPVALMRHLVKMVVPPGSVVLDPFLGSGATALAAEREGRRWIGIEREPKYIAIAKSRLAGLQRGLGLDAFEPGTKKASKGHWPASRTPGEYFEGHAGQKGLVERHDGPPRETEETLPDAPTMELWQET